MQQYDKSGPAVVSTESDLDRQLRSVIERLETRVAQQDRLIESLQKDIRRLKDNLDNHANHINNLKRG